MPSVPAPCCGCNCTACHSRNCCKKLPPKPPKNEPRRPKK